MRYSVKEIIKDCIPGISIDCVVFGYQDRRLHVLLLNYKHSNLWALPGGFLPKTATMEAQANNILKTRTGVENLFLEQFYTFSAPNRNWNNDPTHRDVLKSIISFSPKEDHDLLNAWFNQRFISTAYFALVDATKVIAQADQFSSVCTWISVDQLPELILDHKHIITKALQHLRTKINYLPIGRALLEEKFTMIDLQSLYEAIKGTRMDRGNFHRKMLKSNILIRHEKLMTGAQNKAPYLYSMNNEVYDKLLEEGSGFY